MNLASLSSNLPKPWLTVNAANVNCGTLSCDVLNVPAENIDQTTFFSCSLVGPAVIIPPLGVTNVIADNLVCGSAVSFNLATNTYTATQDGFLNVSLFTNVSTPALAIYHVSVLVNNVVFSTASQRVDSTNGSVVTQVLLIPVNIGETIRIEVENDNPAVNNISVDAFRLMGSYVR